MRRLTYQYHYKKNLKLALPIVFSNLGHMLTALADTLMIGRLGAEPLASASLASNIFSILLVTGIGLSIGVTPLTSSALAKSAYHQISKLFTNGIIFYTLAGITLAIIVYLSAPLMALLNQPPEVVKSAIPYFRLLVISLIPLMLFQGSKQTAEGLSLTKVAMFVSIGANLLNVLLNYLFIFGKLGIPAMGLMGAGRATLIARLIMAAAMTAYLFLPAIKQQYNLSFRWNFLNKQTYRQLFQIGIPIGLQFMFEVSAFSGATVIVGMIGTKALAAHQIALTVATITYMAANGLAAGATVTVSNQRSKGNIRQMRMSAFSVYHINGLFMAACSIILVVFRHEIPEMFIDDPEVLALAPSILTIAALFQLSDGFQVTGQSVLRGLEDVRIPTALTFIVYWLIGLPIGYWLGIVCNWGLSGVWVGLWIGLSAAALWLTLRFNRKSNLLAKSYGQ